jgi:hypothetical protein
MIYRGPGFLAVIWLLSATPFSFLYRQRVVFLLSRSSCVLPVELTCRKRGRGADWCRGAESYDRENAWPSLNHSILSASSSFLHIFSLPFFYLKKESRNENLRLRYSYAINTHRRFGTNLRMHICIMSLLCSWLLVYV